MFLPSLKWLNRQTKATEIYEFLNVHIGLMLLFTFVANCKAFLLGFNTTAPSRVELLSYWSFLFYRCKFYGLVDKHFCNCHAAKEPDLGYFET